MDWKDGRHNLSCWLGTLSGWITDIIQWSDTEGDCDDGSNDDVCDENLQKIVDSVLQIEEKVPPGLVRPGSECRLALSHGWMLEYMLEFLWVLWFGQNSGALIFCRSCRACIWGPGSWVGWRHLWIPLVDNTMATNQNSECNLPIVHNCCLPTFSNCLDKAASGCVCVQQTNA